MGFYDEVKASELSKRGIHDFATGTVKSSILHRHIKDIGDVNVYQNQREQRISDNIDKVVARSLDLEESSNAFLSGEEAYQRLAQARNLEQRKGRVDESGSKLKLNPALHDSYMRDIVENGGAPSLQSLV